MTILVVYEEERIRMISIYQINTTREMSKAFNAADGEAGVVPALDAKRALDVARLKKLGLKVLGVL